MKYFYLTNYLIEKSNEPESITLSLNLLNIFPNSLFLLNSIANAYYLIHGIHKP
jgi:vesicle coat complex subunit